MSILLDALRKSEQQKQLGSAPDINRLDFEPETGGRPAWLRPALAVIFILLLMVTGYFLWKQFANSDGMAGSRDPSAAVATPIPAESEAAAPARPVTATEQPPTTDIPASSGETQVAGETSGTAPVRLDRQPRSPVETLSGDRPYQAAAPSVSRPARSNPSSSDSDDAVVIQREEPRPGVATVQVDPSTSNPAEPAISAPQERAQSQQDEVGLISYWQLPAQTRDTLPSFKISVLVYDTDPAARFVLMNGKRYAMGDEVKDRLELVSIQRERVIFRYGAYRFFVNQGR